MKVAAPPTTLHGPEVEPPVATAPLPLSAGFTGTEIVARITDPKRKAIMEKYGFNLRGMKVRRVALCH